MKRMILAAAVVITAAGAFAENLLDNPSFNGSSTPWSKGGAADAFASSSWESGKDVAGSNLSGAMRVANTSKQPTTTSWVSQCVAVHAGESYVGGGRYFVPSAQPGTGRASASVTYFSSSLCQGAVVAGGAGLTIDDPTLDEWIDLSFETYAVPMTAVSAEIHFSSDKLSGSQFVVYWDDAFFASAGGCRDNNRYLCVTDDRFEVELTAMDPRTGGTAEGVVVEQDGVFGYFSLPGLTGDAANPEVFMKLLDGRPINGRFWVFYSGLTDLEFSLKIRDLQSGDSREYIKPGLVLESAADTSAF